MALLACRGVAAARVTGRLDRLMARRPAGYRSAPVSDDSERTGLLPFWPRPASVSRPPRLLVPRKLAAAQAVEPACCRQESRSNRRCALRPARDQKPEEFGALDGQPGDCRSVRDREPTPEPAAGTAPGQTATRNAQDTEGAHFSTIPARDATTLERHGSPAY